MTQYYSNSYEQDGLRKYINSVFMTMGIGMVITAAIAYYCFYDLMSGGFIARMIYTNPLSSWILLIAQIAIVFSISGRVQKMSVGNARVMFYLYCVINGVTFGTLPLAYGVQNVFVAFMYAAVLFICCAIIGKTTKVDLTNFSGLFMGGLIALLIMQILNMFFGFGGSAIGFLGIALFMGLTAWDMQMIKRNYYYLANNGEAAAKYSIISALSLYLDFINIFLYVLQIMGRSSND
ncbi:MAG: Bax inhibitor-1/YccA family protein [Erysipelotrichaceae bacterium]|nr:Bax inhibitor-1/YccA family protein [Erysipelotrichaceae bacterium]MDY5251775.1 Bax inhibitor-1/YccA family protein [Erysipelotrichaceae bacterium]